MPRMTRTKTDGQAQEVTDNTTHPIAKSGKRRPEEQSDVIGSDLIDGSQGSIIKKGITKENPVLITTGAKSELVKPKNGTITENQKKLMLRMTRAKTAGQAQDVTDYIKHPTSKSRKRKLGEQSGVTGNILINGIQGIIIDIGNSKKNPVLNPTGATLESIEPENGTVKENQKKITPRMTRAKTAGQDQSITAFITHLNPKSGKRKSDEQSVLNLTGATVEVVKPENGVIEKNQKKLKLRTTRARTAGQIQDGTTIITHPSSKPGKHKPEEQSGATGNAQFGGNQGFNIDKGNNKENPALTHTGASSEIGELEYGANFMDADQKGNPTKKHKVLPQPKGMEVDNQTTQTINQPISEKNQINSAIDLEENESMGREEEPVNLDKMFEEQDSIEIVHNPFILNK
eukprot:9479034-Ditylum_brightwellii.AAC.1